MKLKNSIILSALFFLSLSVTAQISNFNPLGGAPLMTSKYKGVEGTPYFGGSEWTIGTAIDSKGSRYENIPLRYNAYEDVLEVKRDETVLIVERDNISSFEFFKSDEMGNREYYFFKTGVMLGIEDEKGYFRVIYEGNKFKVLEKLKTIQIKVTPAAYGQSDITKFVEKNESYMFSNKGIEKIRLSQKSLLNTFPEKKDAIKDYIKENDLNINDVSDLQKACSFINSLL
jgi:hypothetical protein